MKQASSRELFGYWTAKRGSRPAPERGEIEPSAIRRALGDVFILEFDRLRATRSVWPARGSARCSAGTEEPAVPQPVGSPSRSRWRTCSTPSPTSGVA